MKLEEKANHIVRILSQAGHVAYFAGGWVRDLLLGIPSPDIDIATSATPEEVKKLFPKTISVGIQFGIVVVIVDKTPFEVATFRQDFNYQDGRHPSKVIYSDPRQDALRRDFTINGLFYDPAKGEVIDFVDGQADLKLGLIRAIGDPHARFREDKLRILRAFRFVAKFDFKIEAKTKAAIAASVSVIFPAVAVERVCQELSKLITHPFKAKALALMHQMGVLQAILPEFSHLKDIDIQIEGFAKFPADITFVVFIHHFLADLELEKKIEVAKRFKVSNKELDYLSFLSQFTATFSAENCDLKSGVNLFASPLFDKALQVYLAPMGAGEKDLTLAKIVNLKLRLLPHVERRLANKKIVTAADLMQLGVKPGQMMGKLITAAEELAIEKNILDKEQILPFLRQLI